MAVEKASKRLNFRPLTCERWRDFEALFGERGACGGCWCMWWRLTRSEFQKQKGARNKQAMRKIVASGQVPGILAYAEGEPVGWCAIQPRESYPSLERSRVLKPVDDQPVWSITCFFIARPCRGQGVSAALVRAAVAHAKRHGARIIEGYPVEPKKRRIPDAFAWTGLPAAFTKAGFVEVARRSPTRPIMRYVVAGPTFTTSPSTSQRSRKRAGSGCANPAPAS
jgi:GNAT superfamily N-acetyltransferase